MLRIILHLLTVATLGLYATPSSAQIFDLKITNYGGLDSIPALKSFIDTQIQTAENDVNKEFPSGTPDRLMEGMANSSVMAAKGVGTDYASNMDVLLIGAGVGVGADLAKPSGTDSKLSGVGIAPGFIVGLNLGFIDSTSVLGMDPKRLNIYFNFMSYKINRTIDASKNSEAGLDTLSFGSHIRYNWIRPRGNRLLGWGGVKVTTGFEYNKTEINFKTDLNQDINETLGTTGETVQGTITGSPEASILASTTSIPLALSTDVQILYFVSVYTGAGIDYNMGTAKGKGNLNANESTLNCTGGASCGASPTIRVQPTANLDTTGKVNPFLYRAFAGVQLNLPWTRIFVQVDKSLSNELIGATAGLRFAF
jgi:hypothetical protein